MAALDLQTAEADGIAVAAAVSFALSPLQLVYLSDPWSTGSELYGDLAGSLQIRGEADGFAAGSATPLLQGFHAGEADGRAGGFVTQLTLSKLNLQGEADVGAALVGRVGGSLQVAGGCGGVGNAVAPLSGAGNPVAIAGAAVGVGLAGADVLAGPYSIPARSDGVAAAAGVVALSIRLVGAISSSSVPAAWLRINADHEAESDGSASASATMSALAQLQGLSGRDGWERPQLQGSGAGVAGAYAVVSIAGPITVSLAGSS